MYTVPVMREVLQLAMQPVGLMNLLYSSSEIFCYKGRKPCMIILMQDL
jgi:hypothetical protein